MKILLSAYSFYPAIGGIESGSQIIAEEFTKLGHCVTVLTTTPSGDSDKIFPFKVVRHPGPVQLLALVRNCDVYLQYHISLELAWPLFFIRRPWIVALHTHVRDSGFRARLKMHLLKYATVIACSRFIADTLPIPSVVISGPYDDSAFRPLSHLDRDRDLMVLARLYQGKGVHNVLDALDRLGKKGIRPSLAVVGDGPEAKALAGQCAALNLNDQVTFAGHQSREKIVEMLNSHRILIVPSLWQEPFGAVALEGIACGCFIVCSDGGGLKEAIGPCGLTFRNGNVAELADCIQTALLRPGEVQRSKNAADQHLSPFTRSAVAGAYLAVLGESYQSWETRRRRRRERDREKSL
jgi:glycosyltransferase involved in cell wall biosynthesis